MSEQLRAFVFYSDSDGQRNLRFLSPQSLVNTLIIHPEAGANIAAAAYDILYAMNDAAKAKLLLTIGMSALSTENIFIGGKAVVIDREQLNPKTRLDEYKRLLADAASLYPSYVRAWN